MSARFDSIRSRILSQLAKACPHVHVDQAFAVEYQSDVPNTAPRLMIKPSMEADSRLHDYLANQSAGVIEGLKDIGARNGFYVPQNDGRFYIAADLDALDAILNKQQANAQFVNRALHGSAAPQQHGAA